MGTQPPRDAGQARQEANRILDRAKQDPNFLAQLKSQPVETLQAAGLSLEEAREFSQELGSGDVAGYMRCNWTCDRYSCWISFCGNIPFSN